MPVLGLGLHMIVAILLAVHAWRSGQERWWLFVLFLFPLLGSFVYTLLVLLPEVTSTRSTRRVVRSLRASIDPGRELREARAAVEHSVTIANRVRLADALQGAGQHAQAIAAYSAPQTLVLVDCLTLWLTNQLMPAEGLAAATDAPAPEVALAALLQALQRASGPVVLVSNEIGLGLIPMGREVRDFVDALGQLNQAVAGVCERVTLMVAGLPLILKD